MMSSVRLMASMYSGRVSGMFDSVMKVDALSSWGRDDRDCSVRGDVVGPCSPATVKT